MRPSLPTCTALAGGGSAQALARHQPETANPPERTPAGPSAYFSGG